MHHESLAFMRRPLTTVHNLYLQVIAQLLGERHLPWERMSPEDRKKLGAFRNPILQLLERNPAKRPTMTQFYQNCNDIFSSSVTYTPGVQSGKEMMEGLTPRRQKASQPAVEGDVATDSSSLSIDNDNKDDNDESIRYDGRGVGDTSLSI